MKEICFTKQNCIALMIAYNVSLRLYSTGRCLCFALANSMQVKCTSSANDATYVIFYMDFKVESGTFYDYSNS